MNTTDEFMQGINIGISAMLLLWVLSNMLDCCRDPMAHELRKKLANLENENDYLLEQLDELREESSNLTANLNKVADRTYTEHYWDTQG